MGSWSGSSLEVTDESSSARITSEICKFSGKEPDVTEKRGI
jgi:hypothetical protein